MFCLVSVDVWSVCDRVRFPGLNVSANQTFRQFKLLVCVFLQNPKIHSSSLVTFKRKFRQLLSNLWQRNTSGWTQVFQVSVRHFCGLIWTLQEKGRRRVVGKQQNRNLDGWPRLKATQKYPDCFVNEMCVRLMFNSVLVWSTSVSGMFHGLVLLLHWRMSIYIPRVSFHYFYLCAAVSLTCHISFTALVTGAERLLMLFKNIFVSYIFVSLLCQIALL